MRILLINCILSTAEQGVITRRKSNKDCMIYNFAKGFVANGHMVTICASEEFKPLEEENNPFEVIYFKSNIPKLFRPDLIPFPKGLRSFVKDNIDKFDVVIASEVFQLATLFVADICKDKLVVWQELSLHNRMFFKIPSKLWYNLTPKLTALKHALIVPRSESAKIFIKKYFGLVSDEIVEHGANGQILKPIEKAEKNFTIVARLVAGKNIDSIIRRFAEFVKIQEYSDFVLNIVGDGVERANLEELVAELSVEGNIKFKGYLSHEQLAEYLSNSYGLLIDTSKDLNMVSIPESIVSGTPILMNSLPNTAAFVTKKRLGIVADSWGISELVEMVKNYEEFHHNCIEIRNSITNIGCAKKMIDIYVKYNKTNTNESSDC